MFIVTSCVYLLVLTAVVEAQYYCWPCAAANGTVGKYTVAASDAPKCYDWFLKFLNNVADGSHNDGNGARKVMVNGTHVVEAADFSPNVMAMETNECGLSLGNVMENISEPTPYLQHLIDEGLRLPTGKLHQCNCAKTGRAHIIRGSTDTSVKDFKQRVKDWGIDYMLKLAEIGKEMEKHMISDEPVMSAEEREASMKNSVFGVHSVFCPFHSSGPCALDDVEAGVAREFSGNFSKGYVPLMDNNLLLWTASLEPLLDAFHASGVEFFPMRWSAPGHKGELYSVIARPCAKLLIEVAAPIVGRYAADSFNEMAHARAVFQDWNVPSAEQPLVPLRVSRAVGYDKFEQVLKFYGVDHDSRALGFESRVLADENDAHGNRAVTLMLSLNATVHLQLWARHEEEPQSGPSFPSKSAFQVAAHSNQMNSKPPRAGFCASGAWTVKRYTDYILDVHEAEMTPVPAPNTSINTPPVGSRMDVFLDDHISWDCTAPTCNVAEGGAMLYSFGSRIQWLNTFAGWTPYSYDPAGYGVQLHWVNSPKEFMPEGEPQPECFSSFLNGTCPGATMPSQNLLVV